MPKIALIVEGDGEVEAAPILVRNILSMREDYDIAVARPKNANSRSNITKESGLEKFLRLAMLEPDCIGVLLIVDADDECPKEFAAKLAARAKKTYITKPVAIVCANREYEAWFLASLETIVGNEEIDIEADYKGDIEARRGVKEWLTSQMPNGRAYKETVHQAPLTAKIDLNLAHQRSRSFRRLESAIDELVAAYRSGSSPVVTP